MDAVHCDGVHEPEVWGWWEEADGGVAVESGEEKEKEKEEAVFV